MTVTAWGGGFPARIDLPAAVSPTVVVANGATWTVASGVTANNAATFSTVHPSGRTTGNLMTKSPNSGTFGGERCTAVPGSFKLSDYAIIGIDVLPTILAGSVTVRFSSDAFASKRVEYSWPFSAQLYSGQWNRLTTRVLADTSGIDPNGAWVVTGGMAMNEVINGVQISINTTANDACTVAVDRVLAWSNSPARGAVMFGFDRYEDTSLPTIALPLAQRYGISCYAAGDTDKVATKGAAWARVKSLYDAGWAILSQGPDHKDYVSAGAPQLTTDFAASKEVLRNVGLGNALDFFAYPFSSNNAATDAALLAQGVKMASTGIGWNGHPNESNMGYKLIGQGRVNIGGLTLAQVKVLIDRAAIYGVVVDLFTHGLVAGGTGGSPPVDTLTWYANDWEAAILYALGYRAAGRIDITTPPKLFDARGRLPVTA